jgi:hypothetical protein
MGAAAMMRLTANDTHTSTSVYPASKSPTVKRKAQPKRSSDTAAKPSLHDKSEA